MDGLVRPRRGILPILLGIAACVACLSGPSPWAATPEETAAAPATAAEAIPAADITARADGDEHRIQTAVQRAKQDDELQRLETSLARLSLSVNQLAQQSAEHQLEDLPIRRLESLQRHWQLYARELNDLRTRASRVARELSEDAAALTGMRAQWSATGNDAQAIAPALRERIDELIAKIEEAEKTVADPLARSLHLGRVAGELARQVREEESDVQQRIDELDRRLLSVDAPPLWQSTGRDRIALEPFGAGLRQSLAIESALARDHDAANVNLLRMLLAAALVLLPLLLWLRGRARRLVADGLVTPESVKPLSRPWAAWLVLVALFAVVFDFKGPAVRQQLFMLLAWLPMLRLLPSRLLAAVGPWAYLSAGFYLLNMLASLPVSNEFLYRSLLLLLDLVMLATVVVLFVRARREVPVGTPAHRQPVMVLLLGAAGVALSLAAVSNLLGNVSLAITLASAVLDSSYLGLVMYAAVTIVVALAQVLFIRHDVSQVAQGGRSWAQTGAQVGRALLTVAFVVILLQSFRIYRPLADMLSSALNHVFTLGALSLSLGNVVAFVAAVLVAFWVARVIRQVLQKDVLPSMSLPRGVGNSISSLTYYFLVTFGLLTALGLLGFPVGQLAIVFGALGVGIGFGLQDVVKNFVAGLILMFERPIRPGDVVDIAGLLGTVSHIGIRATIVTTFEGADVVIPNGVLLADKLVNWTLSGTRRRIELEVNTRPDVPAERTMELLQRVARELEGVSVSPAPEAFVIGLGGGLLQISLRAWTVEGVNWLLVRSNLAKNIRTALAEAGIELPRPQSEVHLGAGAADVLERFADRPI
ncbi:Small-conductance mechanosensitive channel [Variovorax sp. HW608]|uniref:mechanosensitive ion channel domain-containing protein n=1 Tax=Variovorax sp. HW608 TaxID=1034889 RepID=UPI00081F98D7|nr:mechanosensitive ion channel domain-containing protein [Variovorax sp. HW608]SCK61427.1 Small-conductance mechanosensitive channel [Variovorax sp. HW608]